MARGQASVTLRPTACSCQRPQDTSSFHARETEPAARRRRRGLEFNACGEQMSDFIKFRARAMAFAPPLTFEDILFLKAKAIRFHNKSVPGQPKPGPSPTGLRGSQRSNDSLDTPTNPRFWATSAGSKFKPSRGLS